jgi:hypothetical protein
MRTQRRQPVAVLPTVQSRIEEEDAVDQAVQETDTGGAVPEARRETRSSSEDSAPDLDPWDCLISVDDMKRQAQYHAKTSLRRRRHFDQPDGLWIIDVDPPVEVVRLPLTDRVYR